MCWEALLTQVEKIKDFVHGVFPVGGVVLQPEDQQLLVAEDAQPVHQEDDVDAHLQPHL